MNSAGLVQKRGPVGTRRALPMTPAAVRGQVRMRRRSSRPQAAKSSLEKSRIESKSNMMTFTSLGIVPGCRTLQRFA